MEAITKTIKSLAVLCSDGSPAATDRLIASNRGYTAVQALYQWRRAHVTAFNNGVIEMIPLPAGLKVNTSLPMHNIELIRALAI